MAAEASAPLPGRLEGLIFGMGDVLYDASAWQRWLLQLLSRIGLHTHYRAFCRVWRRDYLVDVHRGRRDYWEALAAMLTSVGLSRADVYVGRFDQLLEVVPCSRGRLLAS